VVHLATRSWARGWVDDRDYSEEAAQNIDKEIQSIVSKGYDRAVELLRANREKLDQLVVVSMEEETLDRDMFMKVMEHGHLPSLPLHQCTERQQIGFRR
jgi:ATP-dependent Zn protease